jgi:hypothetical protein
LVLVYRLMIVKRIYPLGLILKTNRKPRMLSCK